eukprot:5987134-Amphidinium_carterae.1
MQSVLVLMDDCRKRLDAQRLLTKRLEVNGLFGPSKCGLQHWGLSASGAAAAVQESCSASQESVHGCGKMLCMRLARQLRCAFCPSMLSQKSTSYGLSRMCWRKRQPQHLEFSPLRFEAVTVGVSVWLGLGQDKEAFVSMSPQEVGRATDVTVQERFLNCWVEMARNLPQTAVPHRRLPRAAQPVHSRLQSQKNNLQRTVVL